MRQPEPRADHGAQPATSSLAAASTAGELRALLRLALPVMLSRAGLLAMTTVDTVIVGQAGGDELAFLALGLAPFVVLMLTGAGMLAGTVVLVAQAQGAGELGQLGRIWHAALLDAALLGLAGLAILAGAEKLFRATGQTPALAAGGAAVALQLGLGMPALLGYLATTLFLEGLGRPRPGLIVIVLGNLAHVPIDALLVHGWLGLPPMGAAGAALGTTIVRWGMLLGVLGYVLASPRLRPCGVVAFAVPARAVQAKLVRLGFPFALSQGLETGAFQVLVLLCGWLGPTQLAAFQIALNVVALVFMATMGLATATAVRIGRAVGAGEPGRARATAGLGFWVALAAMVLAALPLTLEGAWVAGLYARDPGVVALAGQLLGLAAIVVVLDGARGVLTGALRGAADVWGPMLIHAASFWLLLLPAAWLLAFPAGCAADGLMAGIIVGLATTCFLLLRRVRDLPWGRLARA